MPMRVIAETLICERCGKVFGFPPDRQKAFDYLGFTDPPRCCPRCRRRAARQKA